MPTTLDPAARRAPHPGDGLVTLDGRHPAYRIADHERLPPFLMSVVSAWDHWMFVSSGGALTAGRVEPDRCLFPYETDDRLHHAAGISGPLTLLRVAPPGGEPRLWEPFDRRQDPGVRRHLTKSLLGDRLEVEEVHPALGLTFRYRWSTSDAFGFVRTCTLARHPGHDPVTVDVLDGLLNLMPAFVELGTQQRASCLVDAYKLAELDLATGLGVFSLTSRIVDRAEPAEALRGTVAWSLGLSPDAVLLSPVQVDAFRATGEVVTEPRSAGRRGAWLGRARVTLGPGEARTWHLVADVHLGQAEVAALKDTLATEAPDALERRLLASIDAGSERLRALVASADGVQATGHAIDDAHHLSDVLFNIMRGGVFVDGHRVARDDVRRFLETRNRPVARRHAALLDGLPDTLEHGALLAAARGAGDPDLERLCEGYLPLTFSRRHGDPSRPWNRFRIRVREPDGTPTVDYEGNWRDIFQNWEALLWSFPAFIEPVIATFVNASTVDGFNPYRLTHAGIDWEVPDPHDPWANIGYWGDHQVIYLVKLLELSRRVHPGALEAMLDAPRFAYARVLYRIASYRELLADPHDTIAFDHDAAAAIEQRVAAVGTDGRLLHDAHGRVVHVTLLEKLVVNVLARLSNLVPDGGIWMNTQRPEWNDANNALVGHGLSMVTLCYLRRLLTVLLDLLDGRGDGDVALSRGVAAWLDEIGAALSEHAALLARPTLDDTARKRVLDRLGEAFSAYRQAAYRAGVGLPEARPAAAVAGLARTARAWLDHAIRANRRPDGLYHAYNLLSLSADGQRAAVEPLDEMLEGQVAVLSAGLLDAAGSREVVDALFASALYREDQRSFTLYPERRLPGLLERGAVPADLVEGDPLLAALARAGQGTVVQRDPLGGYRFHPDFRNADDLAAALDRLAEDPAWRPLVAAHRAGALAAFEAVFHHHAYTGRSGTMVAYEGLGSIYWHMVSKLRLAIQESWARGEGEPEADALAAAYHRVREGLAAAKTPAEYGAFPTDPYSHTPRHRGAQQPGMTGQVKEDILCRWGELGVRLEGGAVRFGPGLPGGGVRPADGVSFTLCGVPVHYRAGAAAGIRLHHADGRVVDVPGDRLDPEQSRALLDRKGALARVEVTLASA